MNSASGLDYGRLVLEDRVSSRLYTDPNVFRDEIARIWSTTWVYVGHESELPEPGDYVTRQIASVPIIMVRGDSGEINILVNRCRHRGNTVCQQARGNANVFRCAYHGWCYARGGDLVGPTFPSGYGADFDKRDYGLTNVPRVGSYAGFVFGSLSATGEDLKDHLGMARMYLDQFVNFAPAGAIELRSGVIRSRLRGNWKMPMENAVDGYHPAFLHRSVMDRGGRDAKVAEATVRSRDLGNGHAALDFSASNQVTGAGAMETRVVINDPPTDLPRAIEEHARLLEQSYGADQASQIWSDGLSNVTVFPNLAVVRGDVRLISPVAPGETLMWQFPASFKGAPDLINREKLRWEVAAYGPAGMIGPDDAEAYERTQQGLHAQIDEWVLLSRGVDSESRDSLGVVSGGLTDETSQRAFWRRYRELMVD